ncbi:Phospho-N-acetylmuramoyl-pentapeptide-transferase [Alphaproteobacteria bacterium]
MLYFLSSFLVYKLHILNVFRYITFRSICAVFTSFLFSLLLGPGVIKLLKEIQKDGQPIREDGPKTHLSKIGTPTMGGILIMGSALLSILLWANLANYYIWLLTGVMLGYGILGFCDDYLKLKCRSAKGISGKNKLVWQFSLGIITSMTISYLDKTATNTTLALPFFKDVVINLYWFYFIFASIVIVGSSNAVNLTDGLDGLAMGPIITVLGCFALISYIVGNLIFADYLQLHYVNKAGEITVLCAALIGSGLGFLWYNAPPAKIFMGDVGSLSLGAVLGTVSVITKHEIVLFFTGGLFVIEAVSVILQVGSYKLRKRRIFHMAPIHHHFEKLGWSESTIVMRFWILAILFALIGLSTLKLR